MSFWSLEQMSGFSVAEQIVFSYFSIILKDAEGLVNQWERVTLKAWAGPWPCELGARAALHFTSQRPGRGPRTPSSLFFPVCCQELGEPGVILVLKELFLCKDSLGRRAGMDVPMGVLGGGGPTAVADASPSASDC